MKKLIIIIYIIILTLSLCGCSDNNNQVDQKIQSEIEYLDKKIIGIMNKLNNITLENYEVKSKEVLLEQTNTQSESTGENSQDNQSQGNESSEEENQENSGNIKVLQMQPSNILVIDKNDVDWVTIKSEVETLYSSWNTILLDLYSVNVENEDILNFSNTLDEAILVVKSENKQGSLETLASLYSFLPKYLEKITVEKSQVYIIQTKSNILNAYAQIEKQNWEEVKNQLVLADTAYSKVMSDVNYIENKEDVNRVYILIKELQNSISIQDKDIFYIKYKNLMNAIKQ